MATEHTIPQDEAGMREATVPTLKSPEELAAYIAALVNREHDYGTCVYAMSMAATAAFNHAASRLGVTGFQASCADMDVLRRTRGLKGPFMLVNGEDALYPQYDLPAKVHGFVAEIAPWLAEQAKSMLDEGRDAAPHVRAHWERLASPDHKAGDNMEAGSGHVQGSEWVLVPREPTRDMVVAWTKTAGSFADAYAAMLAAAPKPPSVNDNAVAVNESAAVNDKPESAEAVGEVLRSEGGVARVAMFDESLKPGTKVYTAPPRPEASAPVGVEAAALIQLVEGPNFLRWQDQHGVRLKDTPEWVAFYVATKKALAQQPAAMGGAMALVAEIAQQEPERPDYWSSCGQCERNIDAAQEIRAGQQQGGTPG